MSISVIEAKPNIKKEQIVKSSVAAKKFGEFKRRAKLSPVYISDNGNIDTVMIAYDQYEKMYSRLVELEAKEEDEVLTERIDNLKKNPSSAVSWRKVRRSNR